MSLLLKKFNNQKIICVGLHKTATSSLDTALSNVGYKVAGYYGINDPNIASSALSQGVGILQDKDAAQDDPWYLIYKELDAAFPQSKFILTTRNSAKWIKSCQQHFGGSHNEVRRWFYGEGKDDPIGNEDHWIKVKERHETEVREYFRHRPESFIEIDITAGDDWDKLGPFLGIEKRGAFSKTNTASQRLHHELWKKYSKAHGVEMVFYRLWMRMVREFDKKAFS
jgi:hypothetical protein